VAEYMAKPHLDLLGAAKIISQDPRVLVLTQEEYEKVVRECAEELERLVPDEDAYRSQRQKYWATQERQTKLKAKQDALLAHLGPSPTKRNVDLFWANRRANIRKRALAGEKITDIAASIDQSPQSIYRILRKEARISAAMACKRPKSDRTINEAI
jgi:hypothetical protein